jgi:ligand-binding SRPBCC domain-containing protein
MKIYHLHREQYLNISQQEAWNFFSSANNLSKITPPEMSFKILSEIKDVTVYSGMEIDYIVKPLFGIPLRWKTLIDEVNEPEFFSDKQLKGPYKLWEHSHRFTITEKGLLMIDDVKYQLYFYILGELAHWLFVRKKVEQIFDFRFQALEKYFNQK